MKSYKSLLKLGARTVIRFVEIMIELKFKLTI